MNPIYFISFTCLTYELTEGRRRVVLAAMEDVCARRGWGLIASHVRLGQVHAIVQASVAPGRVLNDFKSYAGRALDRIGLSRLRWSDHGSAKRLNHEDSLDIVAASVGEPMCIYQNWAGASDLRSALQNRLHSKDYARTRCERGRSPTS